MQKSYEVEKVKGSYVTLSNGNTYKSKNLIHRKSSKDLEDNKVAKVVRESRVERKLSKEGVKPTNRVPSTRERKQVVKFTPQLSKKLKKGEYVVREIVDERKKKGRKEYKVLWEGYPDDDFTWEGMKNLKNAKGALQDYLESKRSPKSKTTPLDTGDIKRKERSQEVSTRKRGRKI